MHQDRLMIGMATMALAVGAAMVPAVEISASPQRVISRIARQEPSRVKTSSLSRMLRKSKRQ